MYYEKGKSYGRCLDENRTGFGASDVHRIDSSNYVELIMGEFADSKQFSWGMIK